MSSPQTQARYYVVCFDTIFSSLQEVIEQAPDILRAHQARSNEFHARGLLLMAGAFMDSPNATLSTMGICPTREAAEEFANGDPFLLHRMVKNWSIREWANMFA